MRFTSLFKGQRPLPGLVCFWLCIAGVGMAATPSVHVPGTVQEQTVYNDFVVEHLEHSGLEKFQVAADQGLQAQPISWYYNHSSAPVSAGNEAAVVARIQGEMAKWSAACDVAFQYAGASVLDQYDLSDGINVVGWDALGAGVAGEGGVSVVAGSPSYVNEAFAVFSNVTPTLDDSTILHELGHFLGINHSNVPDQAMSGPHPSDPLLSTTYTSFDELHWDDVAACIDLYGAAAGVPALSLSAPQLLFGNVAVGNTYPRTITITNIGTAALTITSSTVVGGNGFDVVATGNTCNAPVSPGDTCEIVVAFAPTVVNANAVSATLQIQHSASSQDAHVILSGHGILGAPIAGLSSSNENFGTLVLGASVTRTNRLENWGLAPFTVTAAPSLTGDAAYTIDSTTCTLNSVVIGGGSCETVIRLAPTVAGTLNGVLSVGTSDPHRPTLTANLTGAASSTAPVIAASVGTLDFGTQPVSVRTSGTLTITNLGIDDLIFSFQATGYGYVEGAGSTCTRQGMTLAAGASCIVEVRFGMPTVGQHQGNLAITHNAANQFLNIPLTAQVVAAGPGVSGPSATTAVPVNSAWALLGVSLGIGLLVRLCRRRIGGVPTMGNL